MERNYIFLKLIQVLDFGPKQKTFVTVLKCFILHSGETRSAIDSLVLFFVVVCFCDGFICQDAWSRDYSANAVRQVAKCSHRSVCLRSSMLHT